MNGLGTFLQFSIAGIVSSETASDVVAAWSAIPVGIRFGLSVINSGMANGRAAGCLGMIASARFDAEILGEIIHLDHFTPQFFQPSQQFCLCLSNELMLQSL